MRSNDYYGVEGKISQVSKKIPLKNNFIIGLIVAVIIIVVIISFFSAPQEKKFSLSSDGEDLSFAGSISVNGELKETFSQDGSSLKISTNANEKRTITINSSNLPRVITTGKGQIIVSKDGRQIAILSGESIFVDEKGNIVITIDPAYDLGIDFSDESYFDDTDFDFQIIFSDEVTGEEITFQMPVQLSFNDFVGNGCIALSRSLVTDYLRFGQTETDLKIRVSCDNVASLTGSVNWKENPMGVVEIIFSDYASGAALVQYPVSLKQNPGVGVYNAKIVFTPNKEFAGQRADFSVNIAADLAEEPIDFSIALDNLEQCVKVKTVDDSIDNESDDAKISIDASKCFSNEVEIFLCDNDAGCSGHTEGAISLSQSSFSLFPKTSPTKTVTVKRQEIPGVYGVRVSAKVNQTVKAVVDEKEIFVKPTVETIVPDKFVVSLLGKGTKDSVKIKNSSLLENVEVETSICNLYKSSLGVTSTGTLPLLGQFTNSNDWLNQLQQNSDWFAGNGKYQSALFSSLNQVYQMRASAQQISVQENTKIKQAYTDAQTTFSDFSPVEESAQTALDSAEALSEAASQNNDFEDADLAAQYASLAVSAASLYTGSGALCVSLTANTSAASTFSGTAAGCPAAATNASLAVTNVGSAAAIGCGEAAYDASRIYNLIEELSEDIPNIDTDGAYDLSQDYVDKVAEIKDSLNKIAEYMQLALDAASINDFSTASSEDEEAKKYLELALEENENLISLIAQAREIQVSADDEITTLQANEVSRFEQYAAYVDALNDLIGLVVGRTATIAGIQSLIHTAQGNVTASFLAAEAECDSVYGCASSCTAVMTGSGALISSLTDTVEQTTENHAINGTTLAGINLLLTGYSTWRSLDQDFLDEFADTKARFAEAVEDIDSFSLGVDTLKGSLELAVPAAQHLAEMEKETSSASSYTKDFGLAENFDKKSLVGLLGVLVNTGFIDGAYDGGVYTTEDTASTFNSVVPQNNISTKKESTLPQKQLFFVSQNSDSQNSNSQNSVSRNSSSNKIKLSSLVLPEDCENRVSLTLPDYKTNLLQDTEPVMVSIDGIATQWNFSDAKVNDFFVEQEAGLDFINTGLKNNSYATVEIIFNEHSHEALSKPNSVFGPFNIPDKSKETKSFKYHFKFNTKPRTSSIPTTNAICQNNLLLGATGESALPKTILSWDWNAIKSDSKDYLDAVQLSVLLSKKISMIDEFLSRTVLNCPENPATKVLQKFVSTDVPLSIGSNCFLPLTTREYDGKPAIYYFMNQVVSPPDNFNSFFDEPLKSTADEFLSLVDFNVNLIRDGYGLDFQRDFAYDYSNSFLMTSPQFVDPQRGAYRFFNDTKSSYFSSLSNNFLADTKTIIPDAGTYNVKLRIDLQKSDALFSNGAPNAKIVFDLYLKKAINENYSPFYYLPFDGTIGSRYSENRTNYGVSLLSDSILRINNDGASIPGSQSDSLVKISSRTISNIFLLNAFSSLKSKVLSVSYSDSNSSIIFSPTIATPLLFSLGALAGETPSMQYQLMSGQSKVSNKNYNNLFFLTGISTCNSFDGENLLELVNNSPDSLSGDYYGFVFETAKKDGSVYLKNVAYSPIMSNYSLNYFGGQISSTNQTNSQNNSVALDGILGMNYNSQKEDSFINSIKDVFSAVREGSLCVSRASNKEIYWWSESNLSVEKNLNGNSFSAQETNAKANCIK